MTTITINFDTDSEADAILVLRDALAEFADRRVPFEAYVEQRHGPWIDDIYPDPDRRRRERGVQHKVIARRVHIARTYEISGNASRPPRPDLWETLVYYSGDPDPQKVKLNSWETTELLNDLAKSRPSWVTLTDFRRIAAWIVSGYVRHHSEMGSHVTAAYVHTGEPS